MRASDLLGSRVVDREGVGIGPVRDVRLAADGSPRLRVVGVVVGNGRLAGVAHAWGHASARACGPWAVATLFRQARGNARFIPAASVVDWGPGEIRIDAAAADLRPLTDVDAE